MFDSKDERERDDLLGELRVDYRSFQSARMAANWVETSLEITSMLEITMVVQIPSDHFETSTQSPPVLPHLLLLLRFFFFSTIVLHIRWRSLRPSSDRTTLAFRVANSSYLQATTLYSTFRCQELCITLPISAPLNR